MPFICIKIQKYLEKQREIYWTLCNHLMWKRIQMNKHLSMYNWIKFLYTWNKQHQKSTIFQYKFTRKLQNLKKQKSVAWRGSPPCGHLLWQDQGALCCWARTIPRIQGPNVKNTCLRNILGVVIKKQFKTMQPFNKPTSRGKFNSHPF